MSDPREELAGKTGPIEVPREVIKASSPVQAQIMGMVHDLDQNRIIDNRILFKKLDDAAELARKAVDTAIETKGIAANAHDEVMTLRPQIDTFKKELNGRLDAVVTDVEVIKKREREQLQAAIVDDAVTARTKGVFMVPVPSWQTVAAVCSSAAGVITLIATGQLKEFFQWIATRL